ncbi:right-handed parallel beta-helix repeat-containing protein [Catenovulum agarivorans]|uniref:right-handed parallel beta-helix repeat-containing protein n=1 Tax=Catenovulum agarivorans TaxID=1172192 RepID=UPI0003147068|nr:right-handed parallel beta-helix repeat-containing protein [Catenovulum agarivorans]
MSINRRQFVKGAVASAVATAVCTSIGFSRSVYAVDLVNEFREYNNKTSDLIVKGNQGWGITQVRVRIPKASNIKIATKSRPIIDKASLGTSIVIGKSKKSNHEVTLPDGHILTGIKISADGKLYDVSLHTAPFPEKLKVGRVENGGDADLPSGDFAKAPEDQYITGITLKATTEAIPPTHLGLKIQKLLRKVNIADQQREARVRNDSIFSQCLKIYVSSSTGDDANDGFPHTHAVKTLNRAKEICQSNLSEPGFVILLKGGDTFQNNENPMTSTTLSNRLEAVKKEKFAFTWDLDKHLLVSTYDNDELAVLGNGGYVKDNQAASCIGVDANCKKTVVFENLHLKRWQIYPIYLFSYRPDMGNTLTIQDCLFTENGSYYYPEETTVVNKLPIFGGSVIQVRRSDDVIITNNIMKNNHIAPYHETKTGGNVYDRYHAFYVADSARTRVLDNTIMNISGSPVKIRTKSRDVRVANNGFYYTGASTRTNIVQQGWLRFSGDANVEKRPQECTVTGNVFYAPFHTKEFDNNQTSGAIVSAMMSTSKDYMTQVHGWMGNNVSGNDYQEQFE